DAQRRADGAALLRGETIRSQRELVRRDGEVRIVEGSARQLDDGRIEMIARDVTERRRSERTLERLRLAFDQASEGIAVFDRDGGLLSATPPSPRHPAQRFERGMPVSVLTAHREPAFRQRIEAAIREGKALPAERWESGDGAVREGTFAPVRAADGALVG